MIYVYQFALRRADNEKKDFVIERDMVFTEKKVTMKTVEKMVNEFKCDVQMTYIGKLTPPKNETVLSKDFHTKEMIESYLEKWSKGEPENGNSSSIQ